MMSRQVSASKHTSAGQTIFVVMLVMACVFLAIAIACPTYELISRRYWEGPDTAAVAMRPSRPAPAEPAEPAEEPEEENNDQ